MYSTSCRVPFAWVSVSALVLGATFAMATTAVANGINVPIPNEAVVIVTPQPSRSFPVIFGATSAVAAPGGTGYVALNYANPRGGIEGANADGDISAGYTLGNPIDAVSVSFGVSITSLEDNFGDSGNFFVSASRLLRAGGNSATFAGLSTGNLHGWGDAKDSDASLSGYISHLVAFPTSSGEMPVQFTLGYGNQITYDASTPTSPHEGLFAGVGVGVTENLSLSASATATQLNIGASMSVAQMPGLGITAGVYDVTDNVERRQFTLTVAFGF